MQLNMSPSLILNKVVPFLKVSFLCCLLLMACVLVGCKDSKSGNANAYLIRLGDNVVTVLDFNNAFEIVKASYSHNEIQDPVVFKEAQQRLLSQITEEMLILERAKALNIEISDTEIKKVVDEIKSDYPDDIFEKSILESVVSYRFWEERLKVRFLIEKVIKKDLEERIKITPEDVRKYYEENYEKGVFGSDPKQTESEISKVTIKHLRRKKAEEAYSTWIKELKYQYPIEINQHQWKKISGQ